MAIRHVVWDWNGTLLDDVDACVSSLNALILAHGVGAPLSRDEYRARFGFPVRGFYESLGFDCSRAAFERLSVDFIARYRLAAHDLVSGASSALAGLAAMGVAQLVVSAMEQRMLSEMLSRHGVRRYLRGFRGLDTLHASSKVALGIATMQEHALAPDEVLVVGDTLHDLETAAGMGCRCFLFAGGHQSRERLLATGVPVIDRLAELPERIADLS